MKKIDFKRLKNISIIYKIILILGRVNLIQVLIQMKTFRLFKVLNLVWFRQLRVRLIKLCWTVKL